MEILGPVNLHSSEDIRKIATNKAGVLDEKTQATILRVIEYPEKRGSALLLDFEKSYFGGSQYWAYFNSNYPWLRPLPAISTDEKKGGKQFIRRKFFLS